MASATSRTARSTAVFGHRRHRLDPADLADVLPGGGLDLLGRRSGLEAAEGGDVPAHGRDTIEQRAASEPLRPLAQKRPSHVLTTGIGRFASLYS